MYVGSVKISGKGNSSTVSLVRPLMHAVQWNRGDLLKVTIDESGTKVILERLLAGMSPRERPRRQELAPERRADDQVDV